MNEGAAAYKAENYAEVLKEMRPLAEKENMYTQSNMGVLYRDGKGVPANKIVAFALWSYSADLDASPANNAKKNRQALALQGMEVKGVELALSLEQELQQANVYMELVDRYLTKLHK